MPSKRNDFLRLDLGGKSAKETPPAGNDEPASQRTDFLILDLTNKESSPNKDNPEQSPRTQGTEGCASLMAGCAVVFLGLSGFGILIAMGFDWIDRSPTLFWFSLGLICVTGIWISFIERTDASGKTTEIDWPKEGGPITRVFGYTLASVGWLILVGLLVFIIALAANIPSPHITTGGVIIVLLIIIIIQNASR